MQAGQKDKIFDQYILLKSQTFSLPLTNKEDKIRALTIGCILRNNKQLYQGIQHFYNDLQSIVDFDSDISDQVFAEFGEIVFTSNSHAKNQKSLKLQCERCKQYMKIFEFCPRCHEAHFCSQICKFNCKLTHEKEECKIKVYPKMIHAILLQIHFGTDLGQNVEVYFQHQSRAYGLVRGKIIIQELYEFLVGEKNAKYVRKAKLEDKLKIYKVQMRDNGKYLECSHRNQSDFPLQTTKFEDKNLRSLRELYSKNEIIEQISLYLIKEGALFVACAQQAHNNHIKWVYLFRMA